MEEGADLVAYDKVLNISKHPIWMQWQRKRGKYQPPVKVLVGMEWVPASQHFQAAVETKTIEKALSFGELRAEADALHDTQKLSGDNVWACIPHMVCTISFSLQVVSSQIS
jgi:hypothetical protein